MKYQLRWWGTKKTVQKVGVGYIQEKESKAGEEDYETHLMAREAAADWLHALQDFDLVEIKLIRLGD